MVRVFFSPCRSDEKMEYQFAGEVVTVTYAGKTDTFDFSSMPDGIVTDIDTTLPVNPIIEAKRENGELFIKLLNFISKDAPDEEKFPEWQVIE